MKLLVVALALAALAQGKQDQGQVILEKMRHALQELNEQVVVEVVKYPDEMSSTISDVLNQITQLVSKTTDRAEGKVLGDIQDSLISLLYSLEVGKPRAMLDTASNIIDISLKVEKAAKQYHLRKEIVGPSAGLDILWEVIQPDIKAVHARGTEVAKLVSDSLGTLLDRVMRSSKEDFSKNVQFFGEALRELVSNVNELIKVLV